jgi:hypothetical protein
MSQPQTAIAVASIADTLALHSGGLNCHCLSFLDADLQRMIAAWQHIATPIKTAIRVLVESHYV